ncbi:MAG TPA: hypothetical protein VHP14_26130 [Anaerolineales bacterium]|nr:hypothetical protein [Anaerolineales bacterium]
MVPSGEIGFGVIVGFGVAVLVSACAGMTVTAGEDIGVMDPQKHYLVYNNRNVSLLILDLWNKKSQVIAERNKNAQGIELIFANSWSPDGKKLIYRRVLNPAADDICTLFVYDTDRKESIELSPAEKTGCFAAWSPEGENIALPGASGIYIFNVQTTERYRIPFDNLTYLYLEDLFWSGNREKLFFSGNQKIYALDLNSHQLEVIARYSDRFNSFIPSPDKNMMLYEEEMRTSKTDLYLFDITKKNNKKIYSHESILSSGKTLDKINWRYSSVWSPDGEYFAYFTTSEPDNYSRKWTRPITLNIYGVETGNSVSFEVPTKSGYMVFGTYWVYPKQQQ